MKKIEILQSFISRGRNFYAEEQRFVTPEEAQRFCGNGWARDLSGEVATETADTAPKELAVPDGVHAAGSNAT